MVERELTVRKASAFVPDINSIYGYRTETVLVVEEVSMLKRTADRSVVR
jgi:hypothetical protein